MDPSPPVPSALTRVVCEQLVAVGRRGAGPVVAWSPGWPLALGGSPAALAARLAPVDRAGSRRAARLVGPGRVRPDGHGVLAWRAQVQAAPAGRADRSVGWRLHLLWDAAGRLDALTAVRLATEAPVGGLPWGPPGPPTAGPWLPRQVVQLSPPDPDPGEVAGAELVAALARLLDRWGGEGPPVGRSVGVASVEQAFALVRALTAVLPPALGRRLTFALDQDAVAPDWTEPDLTFRPGGPSVTGEEGPVSPVSLGLARAMLRRGGGLPEPLTGVDLTEFAEPAEPAELAGGAVGEFDPAELADPGDLPPAAVLALLGSPRGSQWLRLPAARARVVQTLLSQDVARDVVTLTQQVLHGVHGPGRALLYGDLLAALGHEVVHGDPVRAADLVTGLVPPLPATAWPADPNVDPTADPSVDPTVDPTVDPNVELDGLLLAAATEWSRAGEPAPGTPGGPASAANRDLIWTLLQERARRLPAADFYRWATGRLVREKATRVWSLFTEYLFARYLAGPPTADGSAFLAQVCADCPRAAREHLALAVGPAWAGGWPAALRPAMDGQALDAVLPWLAATAGLPPLSLAQLVAECSLGAAERVALVRRHWPLIGAQAGLPESIWQAVGAPADSAAPGGDAAPGPGDVTVTGAGVVRVIVLPDVSGKLTEVRGRRR